MLNLTSPNKNSLGLKINGLEDFAKAGKKIAELTATLDIAKDKMGNLDLTKLSQSLKANNTNLNSYAKTLGRLGPEGEQSFVQLARGINQAGASMKKSYGILTEFKNTLANTARWQISSSILHGFMGAVQGAYGYAQDLNKSLNNIRIVTGQNIDQMARFADQANKAAKALSATTTDYTNASLIYYQQGLSDAEVKERTDITIKMANAAGQSAEIVSDQMTAVWNNFDDGSKSLEYYADVMTALGAATASSTDEIAAGLEKFSAVAETVGLSYEYATAALATVTAETRQSADVVGTAFKTLFARIEGLKLGETLEDGTDLNKYSQALATVGVQIKDASGNIKNMDDILNDLGARWQSLAKDEKIALAQTVAGVRQYNQLISLMDNWDVMQENLGTAYNSTGTLQKQADIYAESWEAARDRVQASMETIYQQLLDDKFFIALTNGFGKFLDTVSNVIDTLGGLPGVLSVISSILFKIYGNNMANAMSTFAFNIKSQKQSFEEMMALRKDANKGVRDLLGDAHTQEGQSQNTALNLEFDLYDRMIEKKKHLKSLGIEITDEEQKLLDVLMKQQEEYTESAIAAGKRVDEAAQVSNQKQNEALQRILQESNKSPDIQQKYGQARSQKEIGGLRESTISVGVMKSMRDSVGDMANITDMEKHLKLINASLKDNSAEGEKFAKTLKKIQSGELKTTAEILNSLDEEITEAAQNMGQFDAAIRKGLERIKIVGPEADKIIDELRQSFYGEGQETFGMVQDLALAKEKAEQTKSAIDGIKGPPATASQGFMTLAQGISNVALVASSLKGLFDTWNNEDMSFGEKLISTFTTLGMVIPIVTTALSKNTVQQLAGLAAAIAHALGLGTEATAAGIAAGATASFGTVLYTVLWPIGLVIAAIAGLVAIIALLVKAWNADADAAKAAQRQVADLENAYNEAKTAAEDLKSTISDWSSAKDELSELNKGTEEYAAKLEEANAKAKELIETHGLYGQYSVNSETGLIEFDEGVLEELQGKMDARALGLETQLYGAKIVANTAQAKADGTQLARDTGVGTFNTPDGYYRYATSAEMQDFAEVIDQIYAENNQGLDRDEWVELDVATVRQALEDGVEGLPAVIQENLSHLSDEDIQAVMNFRDSLNEAAEANREYAKEIWGNIVEENVSDSWYNAAAKNDEGVTDDGLKAAMKEAAANRASEFEIDGKSLDEAIAEIDVSNVKSNGALNDLLEEKNAGFSIDDDRDLGKTYAEKVLGWDTSQISYTSGTGKGTITNTSTGQEMTLDDNDMRQAIARQIQVDEITAEYEKQSGEDLAKFHLAMANVVANASDEVSTIMLDALNSEDKKINFSDLMAEISPEEAAAYKEQIAAGDLTSDEVLMSLGIHPEDFAELGLGSAEEFLSNFTSAMNDYSEEDYYANLEAQADAIISAGAEELETSSAALEAYTQDLMANNEHLAKNKKLAAEVAVESARFSENLDKLEKALSDNLDTMKNAEKGSWEYYEALGEIQTAFQEAFGVNVDADFIEKNLELIEKAATGAEESVDELQKVLSQEIICNVLGVSDFSQVDTDIVGLSDKLAELAAQDISVGATLDSGEFLDAAQELINKTGMTVEEAQEYFNSLGYEPTFATEQKTITQSIPQNTTETSYEVDWGTINILDAELPFPSIKRHETTRVTGYKDLPTVIETPALSGDGTPIITEMRQTGAAMPTMTNKHSGGGGSGGSGKTSKPKKIKATKKSDIVERYKEITDAMDDVSDAMERANKQADRLYGAPRLAAMKENLNCLRQQRDLLEDQVAQAKEFYSFDQGNLIGAGAEAGLNFEFDDKGNITNYTEQMEKLHYQRRMIETQYNATTDEEAQTRIQEEKLDPLEEKIDAVEEAMEEYENTRELLEDLNMQIQDNLYAEMDAKLEIVQYEVEVNIELTGDDLQFLEYLLSMIEDQAFNTAETMALLAEQTEELLKQNEIYAKGINDILANHNMTIEDIYNKSADELATMGFTQDEIDTMRDYTTAMQENVLALKENQKAIQEQVIKTYEEWNDEFERSTAIAEHGSAVLQHYANIIDIVGRGIMGVDTQFMADLAEGQIQTAKAALDIAQNQYEVTEAALNRANEELEKAKAEVAKDPENYVAQQNLAFWTETQRELDDQLRDQDAKRQAALEAVLEAVMEKYRIMCEQIIEEFEKSLSKTGKSLEELAEDMSRATKVDERYLDDYEQMYYLNKMSRDLQNKIDNTTDIKTRKILMDQLEKINQLKESGVQMSQFDLDILEQQIAMEEAKANLLEAQNTKSQVIRRKDSEGNWGYVYTADEDKVSEAVQKYEDEYFKFKQLSDDYADEIQNTIIQTEQELSEALRAIAEDTSLSLEEKEQKMKETTEFYTDQIAYLYDELDKSLKYNTEVYNTDLAFRRSLDEQFTAQYGMSVNTQVGHNNDLQTSFDKTKLSAVTEFGTIEEAQTALQTNAEDTVEGILKAQETQVIETEGAMNQVGITLGTTYDDYTNFRKHVEGELTGEDGVVSKTKAVADSTDEMKEDAKEDFEAVTTFLGEWNNTYGGLIQTAAEKTLTLSGAFGTLAEKLSAAAEAYRGFNDAVTNQPNPPYDPSKYGPQNTEGGNITGDIATDEGEKKSNNSRYDFVVMPGKSYYEPNKGSVAVTATGTVVNTGNDYLSPSDFINLDSYTNWSNNLYIDSAKDGTYKTWQIDNTSGAATQLNTTKDFEKTNIKTIIQDNNGYWYIMDYQGNIFAWADLTKGPLTPKTGTSNSYNVLNLTADSDMSKYFGGYAGQTPLWEGTTIWDNGNWEIVRNENNEPYAIHPTDKGGGGWYVLVKNLEGRGTYYVGSSNINANGTIKTGAKAYARGSIKAIKDYGFNTTKDFSFDTGGYTGSWGPEGRLAILHQKEIVLNAQDTENFLLATNVLRDIINKIQLTSLQQGINLMNNINTPNNLTPNIEQNITIHAEFPDATDHSEIELAFDNLINKANQFVARN